MTAAAAGMASPRSKDFCTSLLEHPGIEQYKLKPMDDDTWSVFRDLLRVADHPYEAFLESVRVAKSAQVLRASGTYFGLPEEAALVHLDKTGKPCAVHLYEHFWADTGVPGRPSPLAPASFGRLIQMLDHFPGLRIVLKIDPTHLAVDVRLKQVAWMLTAVTELVVDNDADYPQQQPATALSALLQGRSLDRLKALTLRQNAGATIGKAFSADLFKAAPKLERLELVHMPAADALLILSRARDLRSLTMSNIDGFWEELVAQTSASTFSWPSMTHLTSLALRDVSFPDTGASYLLRHPNLTDLDVSRTQLTAASVPTLQKLTKLKSFRGPFPYLDWR
jgi:hypothetical protein